MRRPVLLRRRCSNAPDLSAETSVRKEMAKALGIAPGEIKASRGRGCVECNQKGHRGRVAIYEFFLLNEAIADLIQPGVKTGQLRD